MSYTTCCCCSWIILWQKGATANVTTATACLEAESLTEGRFNGTCTAIFTSVFQGLSAWVRSHGLPLQHNAFVTEVWKSFCKCHSFAVLQGFSLRSSAFSMLSHFACLWQNKGLHYACLDNCCVAACMVLCTHHSSSCQPLSRFSNILPSPCHT